MRPMLLAVILVASSACVDVPDSVRAQFAPPTPVERTNYRPGRHGTAPPIEEPPAPTAKSAEAAVTAAALDADAGPPAVSPTTPAMTTPAPAAPGVAADGGAL